MTINNMKRITNLKLILILYLIHNAYGAQPFYPEAVPASDDQIFTTSVKLRKFIITSCYLTSSTLNPDKYITKQGIILKASTNVFKI